MEANRRTINDLLNGNRLLEIPFFQRSYVWNTPQWERFIEDMEFVSCNKKPYFLGSVILKQELTPTQQNAGDKRTVIDGQQRLTTLCIFLKVLSLKQKQPYLDDIYRIRMNREIAILHNRNDNDQFKEVLNLANLDKLPDTCQIYRAYNYFCENLENTQINPQTVQNNLMFVGIDLSPDDDEQRIFDTINSLGVTLTTAELLKNYFFSRENISEYKKNWQDVFEDEDDRIYWDTVISAGRITRTLLDLFFYSYLQIKIQEPVLKVSANDKNIYSKVEGLFESYKDFIKKYKIDKKELLKEIREYAKLFRDNFDISAVERTAPDFFGIERINIIIFGLENTTLIPYVLFLLKNIKEQSKLNSIFEYLEAYIMRRMICHESTKNYNQLFGERFITNRITTVAALKKAINAQDDKINFMPPDDAVLEGFSVSKLTNKQAVGILYLLETKIRDSKKQSTNVLGINKYSLEHIMPKKWENQWPVVKNDADKIKRNQKLFTLGNLTIITQALNTSISNALWDRKKTGSNNNGLEAFAADLKTFSHYLKLKKWDESVIDKRAEELAKYANTVWKV
jgi:uncharacterized protein with ParB-like and HNH nuclease domain